jgi:cyclase
MLGVRVIPVLLLAEDGLVKTVRFRAPAYVGDPLNAVRIFNEKEVDEIVVLDTRAGPGGRGPDFDRVAGIAGECFMPLCCGGGVRTLDEIGRLVSLGVEKVSLNTAAVEDPGLVERAAARFGSSTIVVSLDVRRGLLGGRSVWTRGATRDAKEEPVALARRMERAGAGEILLTSVDRDGRMEGYDLDLVAAVAAAVSVPVIACGGAGSLADLHRAFAAGASAAAAGSLFVFQGPHRAVLISYPTPEEFARARPADLPA